MDRTSSATSARAGSAGRLRRAPDGGPDRPPAQSPEQRKAVEAFWDSSRGWALREARRSFGHLPDGVREQVVDDTLHDMRLRPPLDTARRALTSALAGSLTGSLHEAHASWALSQADDAPQDGSAPRDAPGGLAAFVENGLGGLERAVLALEIGAGRDTRTSRAALRLRPRQYARHREAGTSKLRDAITGQVRGRACDQHVPGVVAAAMGDGSAMRSLHSGPERCRSCAREAQSLRSALHERLAVAPWPLAVKPAGVIALKLGAVGAALGGKSGGAALPAALGSSGGAGAGAAATVLTAAALATGATAIVGHDKSPRERTAGHSPAAASVYEPGPVTIPATFDAARKQLRGHATRSTHTPRQAARPRAAARSARGRSAAPPAPARPQVASPPAVQGPAAGTPAAAVAGPVGAVTKPLTDTLRDGVSEITGTLPPAASRSVDDSVEQVTETVDSLAGRVDDLLRPGP